MGGVEVWGGGENQPRTGPEMEQKGSKLLSGAPSRKRKPRGFGREEKNKRGLAGEKFNRWWVIKKEFGGGSWMALGHLKQQKREEESKGPPREPEKHPEEVEYPSG